MNFELAAIGHSFKGAMAYYLHDKRQEGDQQHPATAERVAWTETRNLATADATKATRIMIATASQAEQLKAAAGVKTTGRKATAGPVFAFSLQWHPTEAGGGERAQMLKAADEAIKILGLDHLQAVIVAHQETSHPHVHVIVNRIDPNTGKTTSIGKPAVLALDKWADKYERDRGQIVSPNRAKKYDARDEFNRAQEAKAERSPNRKPREKREPRPTVSRDNPAAMLKEFQEAQKVTHKQEWCDLSANNKAARDAIYSAHGDQIKDAMARHKADNRKIWAQHFRAAEFQRAIFNSHESHLGGIVRNALATTAHQQATTGLSGKGPLSTTFGNVLSSQARRTAFDERQDMTRIELSKRLKSMLDSEIRQIKEQRSAALATQRQAFDQARSGLVEKQDAERGKIRAAWQRIYTERGKDAATRSRPYRERMGRKAEWQIERSAVKEHRSSNALPPQSSAEIQVKLEIARLKIEAEHYLNLTRKLRIQSQKAPPTQSEKPIMKGEFDKARLAEPPKPAPMKTAFVSKPSPAPSPAGEAPRPAQRTAQPIPMQPKPEPAQHVPAPRKDWSATVTPANSTPAPAKDWSKSAADRPREIKPLPVRDRSKDRDR